MILLIICNKDIINILTNVSEEISEQTEVIKEEDDLSSFGLDSISIIQVVAMIEEIYNIEFKDSDLLYEKLNTIQKIKNTLIKY